MPNADIRRSELAIGTSLGSGGDGEVFALIDRPDQVYKQYHVTPVDEEALSSIIEFPGSLPKADDLMLRSASAWPVGRVRAGGRVVGCLMPAIPPEFLARTAGNPRQPRELQYLTFQPTRYWGDIRLLHASGRIAFLRRFLCVVRILHRYGVVLGDISQANVLWSDEPSPATFLIDCDALRMPGQGNVCKPKETPDWNDPTPGSGIPDLASDHYKIALLVMRVLAQNAYAVPPDLVTPIMDGTPDEVVRELTKLFRDAGGPRKDRPGAELWDLALRGLPGVPMTPPVLRLPVPPLDLAAPTARQFLAPRRRPEDAGEATSR